ncbi:MAG: hypothetical protein ICV69_08585 [Thermoleophilaceae bacterium]|nr:hypothetical protein [Thermoleophilaceae bacterium]
MDRREERQEHARLPGVGASRGAAVRIFPDDRSLIRLVGMLCLEQNDEWLVGRRYLSAAAMEPLLEMRLHRDTTIDAEEARELTAA